MVALAATLVMSQGVLAETGIASFYHPKFEGRRTASGTTFSNSEMTAAHKTLPFGTIVLVTNLKNGATAKFVITDRGPFIRGRIIDLTQTGAVKLGFEEAGLTKVTVQVIN
jgi:rare lipoprotein A